MMSRVFQPAFVAAGSPKQTHPINKVAAKLYAMSVADASPVKNVLFSLI
jgi:hypothetical protein